MKERKDSSPVNIHERIIEKFVEQKRPPVEIRDQVDIGYTFENYVVEIFEMRQRWNKEDEKIKMPIAKARYYKSKNIWKIYWRRANGNWDLYEPHEEVRDLSEFVKIIDEDKHSCFWG